MSTADGGLDDQLASCANNALSAANISSYKDTSRNNQQNNANKKTSESLNVRSNHKSNAASAGRKTDQQKNPLPMKHGATRGSMRMQKKLAAGIVLSLVCVPALAESGFYSGVGVVQGTLKDNIGGLHIRATDTGFKLFGGYRFNEYGSLEVAYIDGGAPHDTVSGVRVESDGRAIQGSALLHIPMTVHFEGFVRTGFLIWDTENSARIGQTVVYNEDKDGTDFSLGIGAAWHVTSRFGLRAEYEGAELDGTDLRAYSLGGLFRF